MPSTETRTKRGRPKIVTEAKLRAVVAAVDDLASCEDYAERVDPASRMALTSAKTAASSIKTKAFS